MKEGYPANWFFKLLLTDSPLAFSDGPKSLTLRAQCFAALLDSWRYDTRYTNLSGASCELSVDICQLRVDICQLSVASCQLIFVSCE